MNHMSRKQAHRADWMSHFCDKVIHLNARHAGRINWDTASHYYHTGMGWQEAALRYAGNQTGEVI